MKVSDDGKGIHLGIYIPISTQIPLPSRLPRNTEQSSLCYTVGICWLTILNVDTNAQEYVLYTSDFDLLLVVTAGVTGHPILK